MPLTQERMIAVLDEANGLDQLYQLFMQRLKLMLAEGRAEVRRDASFDVDTFCQMVEALVASTPNYPWRAVVRETYHFQRNRRRNERYKERATEKRMTKRGVFAPRASASTATPTPPARFRPDETAVAASAALDAQDANGILFGPSEGEPFAARSTDRADYLSLARGDQELAQQLRDDDEGGG